MTKEDYMRLPKERLAELLVEKDRAFEEKGFRLPYLYPNDNYNIPCYAPNGVCSNPHHDCIGCPKMYYGGGYTTSTTGTAKLQDND